MSAAKIVRAVAANMEATDLGGLRVVIAAALPDGDVDEALHTAADALDALAVPGVAGLLARLSRGETDDFRTGEEERASLATLARIAKEAK